jgi:hypothetical protein
MAFCTECGAAIEGKFCTKCGRPAGGGSTGGVGPPSGDFPALLKDIEFGPTNSKVEAIGRLYTTSGVRLADVQTVLQKAVQSAPAGSLLKFYAAYTLAFLGDNSDMVADAVQSFMSADPFDGPGDTLVQFPWASVPENPPMHSAAVGQRTRKFSTQIATIEAFGYLRGSARAAQALNTILERLEQTGWRLWAIYAAGANGDPTLRPTLEYLRDRKLHSDEAEAASLALEHFGTATVLEIAALHARLAPPKQEQKKTGCFIATAVYGTPEAAGVGILQEFRDEVLLPCQLGRTLVAGYYRVSPSVARIVGPSRVLRAIFRLVLVEPAVWAARRSLFSREAHDVKRRLKL